MLQLPDDALDKTLSRLFKLATASASRKNKQQHVIHLLSKIHLLSASFEINGQPYEVMIDTGATISCLPQHGQILRNTHYQPEKANLLVKMANGKDEHIGEKIKARIRPTGSTAEPKLAKFYIQPGIKDIFGYHALIGLKQLKLFNLDIKTNNDKILIYHQNKLIGRETVSQDTINASLKVVDKIQHLDIDEDIRRILNRYKLVFSELNANPINGKPMRFLTTHQYPVFAKQRHYTTDEVEAMKTHVKALLAQGIIEPTDSGYAATSRIIPKKNGTGRLVVNYIPLNAVTYRDSYSLPHISDILGVLQGKSYFTTMDCNQGFYQIAVDPRDKHKTAFSTPVGNYQFKRCPFGARNSCAAFQAEMNRIFLDGLYKRCVVYVDDILVFGKDRKEHDENLNWVLEQCTRNNVKIKLEKCNFAQNEVKYLGFVVSGNKIKPISSKIDALSKSSAPRDKTELRSIIGKLNFYSRFIPHYSTLLEPLRNLLTKNKDFQWKQYHQQAFEKLIQHLNQANAHVLVSRSCHKYVSLHILQDSIETILTTNENKLVARASRLLSTTESNYSAVEKQLLALVFAINKFKLLIDPTNFTVKAPDKGLSKAIKLVNRPERIEQWLLKMPEGFDTFKFEVHGSLSTELHKKNKLHVPQETFYVDGACKGNGRPNCRASWAVCAEYNKDLELKGLVEDSPSNQSAELTAAIEACKYAKRTGLNEITIVTDSKYLFNAATLWIDKWKNNDWKDNKNKAVVNTELFKKLLYAKQDLDIEWIHVKGHADDTGNIRADTIAKSVLDAKNQVLLAMQRSTTTLQQNNTEIEDLRLRIEQGIENNLQIIDNVIYHIDTKLPEGNQQRIYVPKDSRHWLLNLAHGDEKFGGHLGIKKTYRKLIRFWWPKLHQDVESYVKSCDVCQKFKNPTGLPPGCLHSIPISEIFEHLHIDIVGPLTTTHRGNCYVITATDAYSKWAFAIPSQKVRTSELIKFLEDSILSVHGKPKRIITDRGTQFTSSEWKEFISNMDIEHKLTTPYHPQSNGIDERLNGTLMRILRSYVNKYQNDWDDHLKWSLYVYNNTIHDTTGYSPYQVLHSRDSRSPLKPSILQPTQVNQEALTTNIRRDVTENIQKAQENQRKYYDRHRSSPKLYKGQLVYTRVNAIPTYLCKKFYMKWDGPFVITGFVGEENNPKAVCLFDFDNMKKKIVAIQDVKPMIDTYQPQKVNQTQNGEGHTLNTSCDSRLLDVNSPGYYVNYDTTNTNEEDPIDSDGYETPTNENTLDITRHTFEGPITSSPRRVTVSNDVQLHIYDPRETLVPLRNITETSDTAKEDHQIQQQHQTTIYDYDNSQKDPTYKPPKSVESNTQLIDITETPTKKKTAPYPTQSILPRYHTRSQTTKRAFEEVSESSIPQVKKLSTDKQIEGLNKTYESNASQQDNNSQEYLQDKQSDKLALLVDYEDPDDLILF